MKRLNLLLFLLTYLLAGGAQAAVVDNFDYQTQCGFEQRSPWRPMEIQTETLATYLSTSKQALLEHAAYSDRLPTVHVVMGNQSADLDSIASSIALAYALQKVEGDADNLFVPLINIPREDLPIRRDSFLLMSDLEIDTQDLLMLDESESLELYQKADRLRLSLVDHNELAGYQTEWAPFVERVIDHHTDEGIFYPLMDSADKIITVIGSASTLISEVVFDMLNEKISPELAQLLVAPILMDTLDLKNPDKTTDRDREAVRQLMLLLPNLNQHEYFAQLKAAREDIEGFTPYLLFKKDYKQYEAGNLAYGISSLPFGIDWTGADEELFGEDLERTAARRELDLFMLLFVKEKDDGNLERRLLLYCPDESLQALVSEHFAMFEPLAEVTESIKYYGASGRYLFYYFDGTLSRKTLQPRMQFQENEAIQSYLKGE